MGETYKAIEVRKPGEFAEVRRPFRIPAMTRCAFASRRAVFATRTPERSKEVCLALPIRVFQATRSSGALTRWDQPFAVGRSARGWASAFSLALAVIASFAAAVTL